MFTGPYLNSEQAAEYCGYRGGAQIMRNLKAKGEGPAWVRIGRRLAYRSVDLDVWLASQITETSEVA